MVEVVLTPNFSNDDGFVDWLPQHDEAVPHEKCVEREQAGSGAAARGEGRRPGPHQGGEPCRQKRHDSLVWGSGVQLNSSIYALKKHWNVVENDASSVTFGNCVCNCLIFLLY